MKIVYPLNLLSSAGLEKNAIRLANYLAKKNHDIFFLLSSEFIGCGEKYLDSSIRIIRTKTFSLKLFKNLSKILHISKIFRYLKPDIVHTRNLQGFNYVLAAKIARIPFMIHSEHGFDYQTLNSNFYQKIFRKIIFKNVNVLISVSSPLKKFISQNYGVPENKIKVIYNGVDLKVFHCKNTPPEDLVYLLKRFNFIIGIVARLDPIKNHNFLLENFKKFSSCFSKSVLLIIGDGPLKNQLKNKVKNLNLQNRVFLLGSRKDINRIMSILDVYILPSFMEGMSNTILEAMASCIPVIASNVGGNKELIIHEFNGFLFNINDNQKFIEYLQILYQNTNLRLNMGLKARKYVEENFSLTKMLKAYEEIYLSVLNKTY